MMAQRGNQMDEQICKTEGIAAEHPVTMANHVPFFDMIQRDHRHAGPDDIQQIEGNAGQLSARGVWSHIAGRQRDDKYGYEIEVTVDLMKFAGALEYAP